MAIDFNFNQMLQPQKNGISQKELDKMLPLAEKAYEKVNGHKGEGMQGWMSLPYNQAETVARIKEYANKVREWAESLVVLGIGGSALGTRAVFTALSNAFHNELPKEKRNAPKFYCIDNVDPSTHIELLDTIDIEKTLFCVITKSGSTSETMSQYLIISSILEKKLGKNYTKHLVCVTSEKTGKLIVEAKTKGYETFYIPEGVGGRFSVLSPVGILPLAILGVDIEALLKGAKDMDTLCNYENIKSNIALHSACLMKCALDKGCSMSVMMPYSDKLRYIADWYAQLWGESLGKIRITDNDTEYVGQTPVKALGVTDQHSQLQLYAQGPFDKVITFITVQDFGTDISIPSTDIKGLEFLGGHTLGQLINTEQTATQMALSNEGRLTATITLPKIDEYHLGQLIYFFQMQTAYMGAIMDINPYDQPGVEEGKNITYKLLGKK
jgi:glucose-6-phosphate isomerase